MGIWLGQILRLHHFSIQVIASLIADRGTVPRSTYHEIGTCWTRREKTELQEINARNPLDTFSVSLICGSTIEQKIARFTPNHVQNVGELVAGVQRYHSYVLVMFGEPQ